MTKDEFVNIAIAFKLLNLPEHFKKMKLADLEKDSAADKIAEKLMGWNYLNPSIVSFLSNQNGIGKTHLAVCFYKKFVIEYFKNNSDILFEEFERSQQNYSSGIEYYLRYEMLNPVIYFLSEKKLYYDIRESFNDNKTNERDILQKYCKSDFLVVDDLFSIGEGDFNRRFLFYILDERTQWNKKPTIITSNHSLSQISNIDTRISSRLENKFCFEITSNQKNYRKIN